MLNALKRRVKNEKGLTLIELLAVVVILGIIAAIAIPAIGGLIDNSRKDAHVANATQMINSAKTWAASHTITSSGEELTLKEMIADGLVDEFEDPDGGQYDQDKSLVKISKDGSNKYTYTVTLLNGKTDRAINQSTAADLGREVVGKAATATSPSPENENTN